MKTLKLTLSILLAATAAQAQVNHWRVIKGTTYQQTADNTKPTLEHNWHFFSVVETDHPGDATSVKIQGGNLAAPLDYVWDGYSWELGADYGNKAALDADFSAGQTYSIILSGGTLGTLTQSVTIATDNYPEPAYLTGADFSSVQALEIREPFALNWDDFATIEIAEGTVFDEGDEVFEGEGMNGVELAPFTLEAGSNYNAYVETVNGDIAPAGGFGIGGEQAHNVSVVFLLQGIDSSVGSDDFDDNSVDGAKWVPLLADAGQAFSETNERLEYTSTGAADSSIGWTWSGNVLSYTQNWSVAIDSSCLLEPAALTGKEGWFGLAVLADGSFDNSMSMEHTISEWGREVASYVTSTGVENVIEDWTPQTATNSVSLKISFDSVTKELHTAYSIGGNYNVYTNFNISSWGLTTNSTFDAVIFSGGDPFPVSAGEVYFDNFRVYGEPALSNAVDLIELEFLHSYGDGTIFTEGNWVKADAETSHTVTTVEVLTSGGDRFAILNEDGDEDRAEWWVDVEFPFNELWDSANDGLWTVTFGFQNGTFQSTQIPFLKEDGVTPIPNFYHSPQFLAPSPLNGSRVNTNDLNFAWASASTSANHISVDEIIGDDEPGSFSKLYANSIPGLNLDFIDETIDGPLATTNAGPFVLGEGFRRVRINEGYARAAYNDDGIGYIVVKLNEADITFTVTPDVDDDQMDDTWEIQYFGSTNTVNSGPNDDFDGNGQSNLEEFIAGTNPTNSASIFGVEQAQPQPTGFLVQWVAVPGRKYGVYWTDSLANGFIPLATGILYPQSSFLDENHTAEGGGFYYIDVQLQD